MAGGSWIRINAVDAHLDAKTVNDIIEKALVERAISVTQMPSLRQKIGEELLSQVTDFVPVKTRALWYSGRATDDGRLYWSAINERGEDYAGYVYDPDKTRWPGGKYSHSDSTKTYPQWMEQVQPGTDGWDIFINNITPIIKEAFAKNE